jgi:HEPN domain-containing protein
MVERSLDWIKQAKRDLENAEYELKGGFYEWSCFLSQQASEKAIKAVFQKLKAEAFGHSVAGLLKKLPKKFKVEKSIMDMAKELDRAYIPTRYPNVHPEGAPYEAYTENDAKRLIEYARKIIEYCESLLSKV